MAGSLAYSTDRLMCLSVCGCHQSFKIATTPAVFL